MPTKKIVCLANSRKLSGSCVAGIEISEAGLRMGWVRPVSDRPHQEVSQDELRYEDGNDPTVLDIINIPLLRPQPGTFQQENWLLDPDNYWTRVGVSNWAEVTAWVSRNPTIWLNGHHTNNGINDYIPLEVANGLRESLTLIHVNSIRLSVSAPGAAFGNPKRRVQGQFRYRGVDYHLWVTDPVYERTYAARGNGNYALGECILTISIGEPLERRCYKLIAAIIPRV